MKRNSVDIVVAALSITKTAGVSTLMPGNTVTYTIDYCNTAQPAALFGGRSGVNFAGGVKAVPGSADTMLTLDFAGIMRRLSLWWTGAITGSHIL